MPFVEVRRSWERRCARAVLVMDVLAIASALAVSRLLWGDEGETDPRSLALTLLLGLCWWSPLAAARARHPRVLMDGWSSYRRVVTATVMVFGVFAMMSSIVELEIGRVFLLTAMPLGGCLLLAIRWCARRRLRVRRRASSLVYRTLLVGDRDHVAHIADRIRRGDQAGHRVVGVVTPGIIDDERIGGAPVLAGRPSILDAALEAGADTVILVGPAACTPVELRRLGWDLSERGLKFIIAPTLTGVSPTRLHLQAVDGVPLIHVDHLELSGGKAAAKRTFDVIGSAGLLVVLAPVMLAVAVAVKTTSRGGVLYRQERIGLRGRPFRILKFRSMTSDADSGTALAVQQHAGELLMKATDNPYVTPVGRVLRRYSLDELPQLVNVLAGSMSLVGPRPHRGWEVERYDPLAQRRLLVKPGMSGLWQVSGRSSLSWDDSVDLDLYYVENWTATTDLKILAQTVRAVVAPGSDAR